MCCNFFCVWSWEVQVEILKDSVRNCTKMLRGLMQKVFQYCSSSARVSLIKLVCLHVFILKIKSVDSTDIYHLYATFFVLAQKSKFGFSPPFSKSTFITLRFLCTFSSARRAPFPLLNPLWDVHTYYHKVITIPSTLQRVILLWAPGVFGLSSCC